MTPSPLEASKSDHAYALLRRALLDGTIAPGEPLRLSALAERYNLGLTPLREALSRLQSEHLVAATHNRGFRAADVSIDELADLERSRMIIDVQLLVDAIGCGDDDWEAQLIATHHRLVRTAIPGIDGDDTLLPAWDERHDAFHLALAEASGMVWMKRFSAEINAQLKRYYRHIHARVRIATADRPALRGDVATTLRDVMGIEHHSQLMDAALARDGAAAETLMREHVQLAMRAYRHLANIARADNAA